MPVKINKGAAAGLINLTPMIDVVFQLLLFFLVASRFAEEERNVKMPLPQASEARPQISKPNEFVVNIDHNGRYIVGNKIYDKQGLEKALKQLSVNNPGKQPVVMRTDKRCPFDHVMAAINLCIKAKIRDFHVTAAPDTKAAP